MKVSSENATHINPCIMEGVKEIEPWGMYEQTAWHYVKTMVEEEVECVSNGYCRNVGNFYKNQK